MTTFTLKLIACIAMLIDHTTAIFVKNQELWTIGRGIGRIAFPIFCFLIVEGFFHTSNAKRYLVRLGVFAIISEFAFDFAFWNTINMTSIFSYQNVYFTLFIGLLAIMVYDKILLKYRSQPSTFNILAVITIVFSGVAAVLLKSDYDFRGILYIFIFYIFHYSKKKTLLAFALFTGFIAPGIQLLQILAIPFIWLYNGKKGPSMKYVFYAFYPVHLAILGLIARYWL